MNYDAYNIRPAIRTFDGGLVTSELAELIALNQSPALINMRPISMGRLAPRNGISRLGDEETDQGYIGSVYNFKTTAFEKAMAAFDDGSVQKMRYLNGAAWTDVPSSPSFTKDKKFGFAHDNTNVYFGNGVEDFSYWDGSGAMQSGSTLGKPKGNIYAFYLRRLCIAGNPAAPATLYYSKTGLPLDFTFSGPRVPDDGGALTVGEGGDAITSLKALITPDGESALIVMKASSRIFAVTFSLEGLPSVKELKRDTGAVNDRSTIIYENDILYVDESNNIQSIGFRENIFNNVTKTQTSPQIDDFTPDLDFADSAAWYFRKQKFAIFSCKSFGSTKNDTALVYYQKFNSWWVWKGINANQFMEHDGKLCFGSSTDQNVYFLDDSFDDIGNPIACEWSTKNIDLAVESGQPIDIRAKQMRFVFIEGFISPNGTLKIEVFFDDQEEANYSITLNGDGKTSLLSTANIIESGADLSFGRKIFGRDAFGGEALSTTDFPMSKFLARISLDAYTFRKASIRISQDTTGAPFIITKVIPWMKLMPDAMFEDSKKT